MTTCNSELWHGSVWNELVFSLTMECINFNFPVFLQSSNMSSCTFFNLFIYLFIFFCTTLFPVILKHKSNSLSLYIFNFIDGRFLWGVSHSRSIFNYRSYIYLVTPVFSAWCMRLHAHTHASTRKHTQAHMPPVWCVLKIAATTSVYDTYCLGHWNEKNERKNKNIKLKRWSSCFNICSSFISLNVALPCMTSE